MYGNRSCPVYGAKVNKPGFVSKGVPGAGILEPEWGKFSGAEPGAPLGGRPLVAAESWSPGLPRSGTMIQFFSYRAPAVNTEAVNTRSA